MLRRVKHTNRVVIIVFSYWLLGAAASKSPEEPRIPYPEWLFPIDDETLRAQRRPPPTELPKLDDVELLEIPDSDQKFTLARINDQFNPPDWHPGDHLALPDVVAKGRKPKV